MKGAQSRDPSRTRFYESRNPGGLLSRRISRLAHSALVRLPDNIGDSMPGFAPLSPVESGPTVLRCLFTALHPLASYLVRCGGSTRFLDYRTLHAAPSISLIL